MITCTCGRTITIAVECPPGRPRRTPSEELDHRFMAVWNRLRRDDSNHRATFDLVLERIESAERAVFEDLERRIESLENALVKAPSSPGKRADAFGKCAACGGWLINGLCQTHDCSNS